MLSGLGAFNGQFLLDLNSTENQISITNQQISSGIRVNQASDDPVDIATILGYQNQIAQISQVQTNLGLAKTEASAADNALSSASNLLNQLVSIAAQGASSTATAQTRSSLANQVQGIAQQLVSLANTSVQGQFIFGGDDPITQPYTFNWSVTDGVVQNNTAANTSLIQDAGGQTTNPRMTAQQIFDAKDSAGVPTSGNIFQAVYSLGQALQNNNQAGVQAASDLVHSAVAQLGPATTYYGNVQTWIQSASDSAASTLTNMQAEVGTLRDTDIAAAATQLTLDQTSMQAALAAHGSLNIKSLFNYMG
jgi:flagellar hook-associated protein 3 FlgL